MKDFAQPGRRRSLGQPASKRLFLTLRFGLQNAVLGTLIACLSVGLAVGQEQTSEEKEAAYTRVLNERAAKIVASLGLTDANKTAHVQQTIVQQYRDLNAIHDSRKAALNGVTDRAQKDAIDAEASTKLMTLHSQYLVNLNRDLSPIQVDKVKDGMTYGVLPITVNGYQSMLPDLTDEQKKQILAYLTEAREKAMDEGSSEKKHAMFGKYKGRINNYLSAAGIDMKKASKEWEERIANQARKN
ncbi:DUF3826 domain-containing protein [Spirosoma aerolatum]|uniref:DUF3826 domain-containing protein n=1 Tax=Spirosoma aerolatum TaxID=1211326 RepID=UPI0009ADCAB4|nr:DUF3826 domain-containing protein [Spirosoma aerolatum]